MVQKGLFEDLQAIFGSKKPNEDTANATTTTTEAPKENKCEEVCKNQFAGNKWNTKTGLSFQKVVFVLLGDSINCIQIAYPAFTLLSTQLPGMFAFPALSWEPE